MWVCFLGSQLLLKRNFMKNLLMVMMIALPLIGCTAATDNQPTTRSTTATSTGGVSATTYTSEPVHTVPVMRSTY